MIRRPPRSTPFPTRRSSDLVPGMRERTLVVGSAGKTFNVTGWKVGWICGPAPLVSAVRTAKQFLTYVNGGPFQPAVAAGDRKSTRLNSSHANISYAVFCLKK